MPVKSKSSDCSFSYTFGRIPELIIGRKSRLTMHRLLYGLRESDLKKCVIHHILLTFNDHFNSCCLIPVIFGTE